MKRIIFLILFFISVFIYSFSQNPFQGNFFPNKIPSVNIYNLDGKIINTSNIRNNNKPIIIDFWATWCIPCVRELNVLNKNYNEWKNRTGVKIYIISIDKKDRTPEIKDIMQKNNWQFIVLHDPFLLFKDSMQVIEIPCTFVIDSQRNIVSKHIGFYSGDENSILNELLQISSAK